LRRYLRRKLTSGTGVWLGLAVLRAPERIDHGPLLGLLAQWVADDTDRHRILYETPQRLFGFEQR